MRVFVAGASGAIGRRLVPQLIDAGHEVVGAHNSPSSAEIVRKLGATPVELDLLDTGAVRIIEKGSFTRDELLAQMSVLTAKDKPAR